MIMAVCSKEKFLTGRTSSWLDTWNTLDQRIFCNIFLTHFLNVTTYALHAPSSPRQRDCEQTFMYLAHGCGKEQTTQAFSWGWPICCGFSGHVITVALLRDVLLKQAGDSSSLKYRVGPCITSCLPTFVSISYMFFLLSLFLPLRADIFWKFFWQGWYSPSFFCTSLPQTERVGTTGAFLPLPPLHPTFVPLRLKSRK